MTRTAKVLRYVAFTLMALFGLFGGLFVPVRRSVIPEADGPSR
ncbi:MAG TPA: hypothetical protein VIL87_16240 [Dermatophilaceae bacterium]|jgi:hypothetical protein